MRSPFFLILIFNSLPTTDCTCSGVIFKCRLNKLGACVKPQSDCAKALCVKTSINKNENNDFTKLLVIAIIV